ncbi:MAG TPA: efflux RND transporter permease subunit, partial [Sandaracinaceae bacterium]
WGTDLDTAATDVRSKLEDEIDELPDDIVRPRINKFDIAGFPIVILGISSALDPVELTTIVDEQVRPRLARIPGVAQVDPWGSYEREVRVELDPDRLRAYSVPLDAVLEAVRSVNLDRPAGSIESSTEELTLRAPSQLTSIEQLESAVVVTRGDGVIRIRDLGTVRDTYRRLDRIARIDGRIGLRVGIRKQADANTVEVSQAILEEVERINRDFPQLRVTAVSNQGDYIERSIDNLTGSVLYGGALAILVLLFFLRNVRSTIIIAIAIPISLIATFALLYLADFTLNLMTLGGLALGVGMMVDNSIVVLDNIFRRTQEERETLERSAVEGTREVGAAIVASTLTTIVIFAPVIFVRGVSGELFRELAYVVVFSLACSLAVSLTLVPMLCARLLGGDRRRTASRTALRRLDAAAGRAFDRLLERYREALRDVLRRPWRAVLACLACLAVSSLLVPTLDTELFPPGDEGSVSVTGEMPVGTKLALVDAQTRKLEELAAPLVPEAVSTAVSVGASGWRPGDGARGEIRYTLAPLGERERSSREVAAALRRELTGAVAGMDVRVQAREGNYLLQRVLGTDDGQALTIEVYGPDLAQLDVLCDRVMEVVAAVPGVTDVERSHEAGAPQIDLRTDWEAAADLGVSPADVAQALEIAIAGRDAGDYRVGSSSYRILVQLADAPHRRLEEILDLTIRNAEGALVRLGDVTTTERLQGPMLIERKNQRRIMTVRPNVADRPLGSVAADIEARLSEIPTPPGYELRVAGIYEEQEEATRELVFALLLSLVLVFMVLAGQYESFVDPLIVMLSVPMAAVGVLVALAATGTTLNVQSYIGCIMLGGIVVNNAVLLVDQAGQLRRAGASAADAMREAGRRRLRPILMTTATTLLGLVPLALGIGEGAEAQAALARAVLGGLTASTFFTLLLIPAVYVLVHGRKERRA